MMKISELEKVTGIPRTTIHFYIREGLLPKPRSAGKTMAYYGQEHVKLLAEIRKMREIGLLPLKEIKKRLQSANRAGSSGVEPLGEVAAATKKRILDAAIKEFSAKGYRKTRVTNIISSLGIATMTFYRYFPNKRQLFLEVVDTVVADMVDRVEVEISGEEDFIIRMLKRGLAFYDTYTRNRDILHILWGEAVGEDREFVELVKRIYDRFTSVMIEDIDSLKKEGNFPDYDSELLSYIMLGASELVIYRLSMDDRFSIKDYLLASLYILLSAQVSSNVLDSLRIEYEKVLDNLLTGTV